MLLAKDSDIQNLSFKKGMFAVDIRVTIKKKRVTINAIKFVC